MISNVLFALRHRIQDEIKKPVYILDTPVEAIDKNVIYLISPSMDDISTTPLISSSSMVEFTIHLYEVVHIVDVSRQKDIQDNIGVSLTTGSNTMSTIFNKVKGYRNICGANLVDYTMGTASWVVNTKVYTAYDVAITFKAMYDI